ALPRQLRQRINHRRRNHRHRRLATAGWSLSAGDDVHIHRDWDIGDICRRIAIKILLLNTAVFESDRAAGHQLKQAKTDTRLKLAFDGGWIDGQPAVQGDGRAVNPWPLILDRYFHRTRDASAECFVA